MTSLLCEENAPNFKKSPPESQVGESYFCEVHDKSALQGGYLAGRVPATDKSST